MDDFTFTSLGQKGVITSCNPWSITLKRPVSHFHTTLSALRSTRHYKALSSLNKSMLKRFHNNFIWLIFGIISAPDPRVTLKMMHPHINWKCFRQTSVRPSLAYILTIKHFSAQSINLALLRQVLSSCCILYIVVSTQHIHASDSIWSWWWVHLLNCEILIVLEILALTTQLLG